MSKIKFMLLRRVTQIGLLVLYFGANAYGWSFLKGDLSSSLLMGKIPLADPYAVIQILCTGVLVGSDVLIGALIIMLFYATIGGRAFCSWVCPVNMVTDFANFLRVKLGLEREGRKVLLKRNFRYWVLGLSLLVSFASGVAAFELVSPIGILTRGVIFGMGMSMAIVASIFLFDLLVLRHGWCGYVCPLGASFSLIGKYSLIKVNYKLENCTSCMKCVQICPESKC